jgi:hypothetical protein
MQPRTFKMRLVEHYLTKVSLPESRSLKVCRRALSPPRPRSIVWPENAAREIRSLELGACQIRIREMGPGEIGAFEMRFREICSPKVHNS